MTKLEVEKLEARYERLKIRYRKKTKEVDEFISNWLSRFILKLTGAAMFGFVLGRLVR